MAVLRPTFDRPMTTNSPSGTPVVDKRLGDAFPTVQYVADNMSALLRLVPGAISSTLVKGSTWLKGMTVELPLPADIPVTTVVGFTVQVRDQNLVLWDQTSGHWTQRLEGGVLKLTLLSTAPTELQNSPIYWNINHER